MPCGINEMRHALVEHFRSSTESSDARLAESLARLCKHTLRTQICIYDSWTHQEHTSQAICYLVKSALNSILEEPPTTSGATSSDNEQEVDSDDLPSPTELCALIPSDVNTGHQDTFLAKVLKYTHDGRDAQLAWLRELDTCPNYYEFQAGTDVSHEKKPAILSTFTSIDLKGCTSLGHPTDPSLWLFGNHPLNRRHLRAIVERQGDQVFDSFWMSWIEQTVKRLANKYVDKKIIENKKL